MPRKGLEKGAVDYITKPYDDREVIARIQIHLKIRDLEKERVGSLLKRIVSDYLLLVYWPAGLLVYPGSIWPVMERSKSRM